MKLFDILANKDKVNVAFIGGSLTEGAGASSKNMRYTTRVTRFIAEKLPNATVTEINAAIGGTTSSFGIFRLGKTILEKDPDILFIEYAVNDGGQESLLKYVEGIVRTARRWKSDLPIVMLGAFSTGLYDGKGEDCPGYKITVLGQMKIAAAYGIPYINMGKPLYDKIVECGDMKQYIVDSVHPNDAGYEVYYKVVADKLPDAEFTFEFPENAVTGVDIIDPKLTLCSDMDYIPENFILSKRRTWYDNFNYLCSDVKGATARFEFEGNVCGIYSRIEKDSGIANIYIDGKHVCDHHQWDIAANDFDRESFLVYADDLPDGKHVLEIKVSGDKNPESEGHVIRIVGLLTANRK